MNCEYCVFSDHTINSKCNYFLHLILCHGEKFTVTDFKKAVPLPHYKGKQVYRMNREKLKILQKVSKEYVNRKFHRTCCKTCLLPFRTEEIVITAPGSRSLRHLSCAKRVLYV